MPYEWHPGPAGSQHLHLTAHQALSAQGFVTFIGATAALIAAPALAVLGSPVMWALLPFLIGAVAAIWFALRKNARDRAVTEDLVLTRDQIRLVHRGPHGQQREWQANPYWIRAVLHPVAGPVPHYLTLAGAPREVELGAFLAAEERIALAADLGARLAALRASPARP